MPMTKADQIRQMPAGMDYRVVAEQVGCHPDYVRSVRWRDQNWERFLANGRRSDLERRRKAGVLSRGERAVVRRDQSRWIEKDAELIRMVKLDLPRRLIAERLGETKNAVIGRANRLREWGLL